MNPDLKVYRTQVDIDGIHPELKTGMSCMAEVLVEEYEKAVYVPVQALVKESGQSTVYVRKRGAFRPVEVTPGLDNGRMVHILDGLRPGQKVLLTPPLSESHAGDNHVGNGSHESDRKTDASGSERADAHTGETGTPTAAAGKSAPKKPAAQNPDAPNE